MQRVNSDTVLGVLFLLTGVLIAFVWAPLDSGSPIVERIRGRSAIGDAMAPTICGFLIGVAGLALCLESLRRAAEVALHWRNLRFLGLLLAIIAGAILVIRFAGPGLVAFIGAIGLDVADYRSLRDTIPWKYTGYLAGGTVLIGGLIALVERRLRWRSVAIGFLVSLAFALAYDLPFDTLVLPPNGDV